ncbi:GmrSD restriction endonuclease domain-containing protein [Spirulina major]|uniref:GmrSD restriction endonuclease domain-containing protein n=1 Tax=Spirulina major TaxID=270636 RepID=UPI000932D0E9|nr:DUF262 domain-containing protein [Spirulina major]
MTPFTIFDSTKESLSDVLQSIKTGKSQLPDFQRGWVWDDEHIRGLLASIALSYPIGTVMLLQTGNPDVKFRPRLVEGVELDSPPEPERLILDGQQRLTSLFQALFSNRPVLTYDTRKRKIKRWYYLDINKAIDPYCDAEDYIISLPEGRKLFNFRNELQYDYSTREKECESELLPLPLIFDGDLTQWQMCYLNSKPEGVQERLKKWNDLDRVIQRYKQYQVPIISLRKETPKEAVCQVFEKVNTGGVALTVFELITATFATDNFSLRDDWSEREKRFRHHNVLDSLESTDFLQAISLLVTRERRIDFLENQSESDRSPAISCKRKDVLRLTLKDYQKWADLVTKGFEKAARLLQSEYIFSARDLPYRTQLTPMAAMFAVLGDRADNDGIRRKIARWYWCGVFGELYGGSIETRFAKDLPEVLAWIDGGTEPDTINDSNFAQSRLMTLKTRNSAAYKGLFALLMRDGGQDFRTGEPMGSQLYFEDTVDIHHIFPKQWCQKNKIDDKRCNSIINKTPISAKTNRMIGGNDPSRYLKRLQENAEIPDTRMDEILKSHCINPNALRSDDFNVFFEDRENALISRIERATGKVVARDAVWTNPEEDAEE